MFSTLIRKANNACSTGTDISLEVWGASRKSDVLEKALGLEVVLAAGL